MRWPLLYCALLAAIVGMVAVVRATVTLKKTDTAYILPEKWREIPTTEQAAYDPKDKMLYVVGGTFIHVLNISNPYAIKVVQNYTERESGDMTDVEICGDYLAVGYDSYVTPLQGKVFIFSRRSSERPMMKVNTITVGSLPDMVHFTEDCRRVVVAIEGELRKVNTMPIDPPGAVEVIRFVSDDLSGNYEVKIAHFFKFNSRAEDYVQKGVRWVYRGQGMSRPTEFYQDLEPEYIALSGVNKSIAYVALQENNGIAKVDIDRAEVLEIYPLGYKIWSETPIDPSDKDGGIRLNPWRVYGMFLPDTIKCVTIGGADYILTANEGDAKEYEMDTHGVEWSEEKRGKQFSTENLLDPSMPASLRGEIADDAKLGRMTFTTVDGRNQATGKFKSLYSFGGRSFSVFRASDMSLVYDSAGHVEQRIAESYPRIFNADIKDIDQRPDQTMDIRSSKKGPETESMATAQIGDRLYVFVGHERPGIISIYSFPHNDFTNVQHEGIYQGLGPLDNTKSWRQKYEDKEIEFIDPEDIIYVPAEQSSKGKPLLVVTGAKSNSVSVYEIIIGTSDTSGDGSSAAMTQTSLLTSFLACLITYCIAFTR